MSNLAEIDLMDALAPLCEFYCVGSRVTCNPAPTDTDADFLVFVRQSHQAEHVQCLLRNAGFETGTEEYAGQSPLEGFTSWRLGVVNYLVTADAEFKSKFLAATAVCKRLNLLKKADRIAVFQAVLYANGEAA